VPFHGLLLTLGCAASLQVEDGRKSLVDSHVRADSSPETCCELCSVVGGNVVWYIAFADHVLERHIGLFWAINILLAGQVHRKLSQLIDYDHNPIESLLG